MSTGNFEERATRVPADRVMIRFGPEVRKHLKELEKITDHPAFDDNMHEILKSLNSSKPTDIQFAITQLAMVVRNVTQFAQETGNKRAMDELNSAIGELSGQASESQPVIVSVEPRRRGK